MPWLNKYRRQDNADVILTLLEEELNRREGEEEETAIFSTEASEVID